MDMDGMDMDGGGDEYYNDGDAEDEGSYVDEMDSLKEYDFAAEGSPMAPGTGLAARLGPELTDALLGGAEAAADFDHALLGDAGADADIAMDGSVGGIDFFGGGTSSAREIKLAVVGRPNVGKSSLANRLLGANRSVVHHVAGTTRDLSLIHI